MRLIATYRLASHIRRKNNSLYPNCPHSSIGWYLDLRGAPEAVLARLAAYS